MEGIVELQTQARDKVAAVESNVNKVSEELKKLINSIPPQFRQASGDDVKSGFG